MSEVIAKVYENEGLVEGGLVELSNGETVVKGRVAAVSENEFLVDWEDGARSVENKADYELVVATVKTATKCQTEGCSRDATGFGVCDEHNVKLRKKEEEKKEVAASKEAAENPAQPAGWAVPPVDADAYPGGELMAIEEEKRADTAGWEDSQNRAPIDGENPAQPAGFAVPPASGAPIPGQGADGLVMANVYAEDITGENGRVELSNGTLRMAGRVIAADDAEFIVEWEDERRTVESKNDYDLVITASEPVWEAERQALIENNMIEPVEGGKLGCKYCRNFSADTKQGIVDHFGTEHENDGQFSWMDLPGADDV